VAFAALFWKGTDGTGVLYLSEARIQCIGIVMSLTAKRILERLSPVKEGGLNVEEPLCWLRIVVCLLDRYMGFLDLSQQVISQVGMECAEGVLPISKLVG
jgi:hypothetical protein